MQKIKYLVAFVFISCYAVAQHGDRILPLRTNPVLTHAAKEAKKTNKHGKIGPPPPPPIKFVELPFLDDFSKPGPYPDTNLWRDRNAFVNYTYPMAPHTLGVATLDGVNSAGMPYDPNCPLTGSYPADTLTSQFIKLGNHAPGDSIYFSFYYQAGGYGPLEQPISVGSFPKPNDTLILEFFNGVQWNEVWYHLGYLPVTADTNFHFVHIMLDSMKQYFINGFQFRFRSYANTSGNLDHWNIDEVYLNRYRSYLDTFQYDVSFVYESPSLLNNYEAMPWEQLASAADFKTNINVYIRQNDTTPTIVNTSYYYDSIPGFLKYYAGGANGEQDYFTHGYTNYAPQTYPPLIPEGTTLSGPTTYTFTQYLKPPPDFDAWNDTLRFNQVFDDYYAYDDGTAEAGYSVLNSGNTSWLACQFTLNHPDTLQGVYVFFNYVLDNASPCTFHLCLWNDGGGYPGTRTYEDDSLSSPYYGDSLDEFVYYPLHIPSDSLISGTFYIGWQQIDGDSLNVGFDWNDNNEYKIFYNLTPTGSSANWNYCSYPGSLMIRPVFGSRTINSVNELRTVSSSIKIYPDPAKDEVYLTSFMQPKTLLNIYTIDGRLIQQDPNFSGNRINTSNLPEGFYMVELTLQSGKTYYQKLLISR